MVVEKEIPWCTIFLVLAAFTANTLVLIGNLDAAASFHTIGQSAGGWSDVGTAMAKSFDSELATLMNEVTLSLSHAVKDINEVNNQIDSMVSEIGKKSDTSLLELAGSATNVALMQQAGSTNAQQLPTQVAIQADDFALVKKAAMKDVKATVNAEVVKVNTVLRSFLKAITPALLQIGKWEISFGSKLQADIAEFGTTIDWVQKSFDTMMAKLKGPDPAWEEFMIYNTFNLFDPTANNCITQKDLLGAAAMYGVTPLQGIKGEKVFKEFADKDGCIDQDGYLNMLNAPGLDGIVTTVLRTYAEGLSKVAGTVGQARLRPAAAACVVTYLDFESAKNHTKVGWIVERLTNSSLPMAFTSVVMMELGMQASNPNILSTIDVGQLVIDFMLYQNMSATVEAFDLMSKPSFWTSEGFLPTQLSAVVGTVGHWMKEGISATQNGTNPAQLKAAAAEGSDKKVERDEKNGMDGKDIKDSKNSKDASGSKDTKASLLQVLQGAESSASALAEMDAMFKSGYTERMQTSAAAEIERQKHQDHLALVERRESLTESHSSSHLFRELLGGKTMSQGTLSPTEWQVLHQGVPAVPATLEFTKFLGWNASRDAGVFLHGCFKYSSTSSNQLNAFANEIKSFVGKTQSFLTTIMSYSGQKGIDFLDSEITGFVAGAEKALVSAIEPTIDAVVSTVIAKVKAIEPTIGGVDPQAIISEVKVEFASVVSAGAGSQKSMAMVQLDSGLPAGGAKDETMMVFEEIRTLMGDLMSLLPSAVSTVNGARDEVAQVAQVMTAIFEKFGVLAPSLFDDISFAYSALWTVYFIFLLPLTLGTLYYAMWASGWMGGPQAADWQEQSEEEAARPTGFCDRLSTCWTACCICCGSCHDSAMFFWSCIIIYQVIVLVIFIVAIVLCMLNGIKLFFTSSCLEIYMLDQSDMCLSVLNSVKGFISSFVVDPLIPLEDTCNRKSLLMCELIGAKMQRSMVYTTIFSFVSAILQFQLVIESCVLHERARMRRIVQEMQKRN